jgi:hypothetical protein
MLSTTGRGSHPGPPQAQVSEPDAGKILYDAFKSAINALTVQETGTTRIEDRIRLKEMRSLSHRLPRPPGRRQEHLQQSGRRTPLRRL